MLASIDGIGKQNEFIRTNSKWETTDKNLKILLQQDNINVTVAICVSKLNIHNLHVICDYLLNLGMNQRRISVSNILYLPKKFCIKNMNTETLYELKKYIKNNKDTYPITTERLTKVLEWIEK